MLVFCAIATPCPRAPTSFNPFACRFNVACTPTQPQACLASHNFQQRRTRDNSATRATSTAHLLRNARRKCTSHTTASAAVGAQRIRPAAFFLPTCSQHATTALPRLPCRTQPCCSLLCRGRAPFAALCTGRRDISVLTWPARPPSPALYVCVCVLGMVMFQCRPMCFLPSGRLPFAVRLFLLSVGLAIAFVFGFG